ncbi:MAG: hypothetical protein QM493_09740 [Sulfurovum sp.]
MSQEYKDAEKDISKEFVHLHDLKDDYLKYKFPALFIWVFSIISPEINFYVILSWIIAFVLLTYAWSIIISIIMLISAIGIYIDNPLSYVFLSIFMITAFVIVLTPKEIHQNPLEIESKDEDKDKKDKKSS